MRMKNERSITMLLFLFIKKHSLAVLFEYSLLERGKAFLNNAFTDTKSIGF